MILQQIYSGNSIPNFIRIARVLGKVLQEKFWSFFWTLCILPTVTWRAHELTDISHCTIQRQLRSVKDFTRRRLARAQWGRYRGRPDGVPQQTATAWRRRSPGDRGPTSPPSSCVDYVSASPTASTSTWSSEAKSRLHSDSQKNRYIIMNMPHIHSFTHLLIHYNVWPMWAV